MDNIRSVGQIGSFYDQALSGSVEHVSESESFQEVLQEKASSSGGGMDAIFAEASSCYNLPVGLLKAVATVESNFNPTAVSSAGAMGVMQLMPRTAQGLGVTDPFDDRQNIMGGAQYLRQQLNRFGDVRLALAAYNAGPGNVSKYGGMPPFPGTQRYVDKIMGIWGEEAQDSVEGFYNYTAFSSMNSGMSVLGGYDNTLGSLNSLLGNLGSSSNILGSLGSLGSYGSSYNTLGSLGSGYSALGSMNLLSGGINYSSMYGLSSLLSGGVTANGDGDTITMDRESFTSLLELMRIQMMMNAEREVGAFSLM